MTYRKNAYIYMIHRDHPLLSHNLFLPVEQGERTHIHHHLIGVYTLVPVRTRRIVPNEATVVLVGVAVTEKRLK